MIAESIAGFDHPVSLTGASPGVMLNGPRPPLSGHCGVASARLEEPVEPDRTWLRVMRGRPAAQAPWCRAHTEGNIRWSRESWTPMQTYERAFPARFLIVFRWGVFTRCRGKCRLVRRLSIGTVFATSPPMGFQRPGGSIASGRHICGCSLNPRSR